MRIPDPLILGAGPAGCAAAIALARGGAKPLLIDRDAVVRNPLCGGFISWRTAEQLVRLGVDCAELGAHRVSRLRVVAGDRSASAPLPAPAWGLSRHALDTALRSAALATGARFATDTIRSVEGLLAHGSRRDWTGEALFLASGKHDVRGLARPRMARDPALGLRLRLPTSPALSRRLEGTIELHLFAGGYAGIVLHEGGSANICLAVKKSLLARHGGDPASMLSALGQDHPHFAERIGENWRDCPIDTVGAVPYGWIAQDTAPGLFRLGDQAAVIPSLAGEGMGIALASGAMAAEHFLTGGSDAAIEYQRRLAACAASPLRLARIARGVAERPVFHGPMLALLARIPAIAAILMDATRIPVTPSPCASAPRC